MTMSWSKTNILFFSDCHYEKENLDDLIPGKLENSALIAKPFKFGIIKKI